MINPTGGKIRVDSKGDGHFGAPRSKWVAGKLHRYKHVGVDHEGVPGQPVKALISAKITRPANPYGSDDRFKGVYLEGKDIEMKCFYVEYDKSLIGQTVREGQVIGTLQDIGIKYPGATPHTHSEIVTCNPELLMKPLSFENAVDDSLASVPEVDKSPKQASSARGPRG